MRGRKLTHIYTICSLLSPYCTRHRPIQPALPSHALTPPKLSSEHIPRVRLPFFPLHQLDITILIIILLLFIVLPLLGDLTMVESCRSELGRVAVVGAGEEVEGALFALGFG